MKFSVLRQMLDSSPNVDTCLATSKSSDLFVARASLDRVVDHEEVVSVSIAERLPRDDCVCV